FASAAQPPDGQQYILLEIVIGPECLDKEREAEAREREQHVEIARGDVQVAAQCERDERQHDSGTNNYKAVVLACEELHRWMPSYHAPDGSSPNDKACAERHH